MRDKMRHLSHSLLILNGSLGVDRLHERICSTIKNEAIISGQSVGALMTILPFHLHSLVSAGPTIASEVPAVVA